MHCCLLGATKRLCNLFLLSRHSRTDHYIPKRKQIALNNRILKIKPNSSVVRKPRSFNQQANFKASEYRSMLLYYLPICLPGSVPHKYVQHVRLLSAAIYKLLQTNISFEDLVSAEDWLSSFVLQHQNLFGKESMVMVVHMLKHLADSVRHLGPLWSHSAFPFERNNGCLLKLVNGTSDVLHQISSKYALSKSLSTARDSDAEVKILLGKATDFVEHLPLVFDFESLEILNFSEVELEVFKRIRHQNVIYTSLLYTRPKKSIDYFIELVNGTFGAAKFYFVYKQTVYVMLQQYQIIEKIYHISKIKKINRVIMAPIVQIEKKLIFMTVGVNNYVTCPPNPYEIE